MVFVHLIFGFILASGFIFWVGRTNNRSVKSVLLDYDNNIDPVSAIPILLVITVFWPVVLFGIVVYALGILVAKYVLWLYNKGNKRVKE